MRGEKSVRDQSGENVNGTSSVPKETFRIGLVDTKMVPFFILKNDLRNRANKSLFYRKTRPHI